MPLKLIRRKGSPVWYLSGTIAGERVREASGTTDKRLAEEVRAVREAEMLRAAIHGKPALRLTWEDACLSYCEVNPPSTGTAAMLARLTAHFGRMKLAEIRQAELDRAASILCRADAAPATRLRNVIGPARAVLMHAARRGWCDPPMVEKVPGAGGKRRTRWLTPDEYARLRDAIAPHLRPLLTFLAGTGARLGSALALDWQDVDLRHGRALLRDTKNGNDHTVDLPPAAVAAMAMIEEREGRVFRADDGRPYRDSDGSGGQIRSAWATACRKAKLGAEVTPHTLRHTWASWRYAYHRDLLRLKAEGDWSSVALCERYAKLVPEGMLPAITAAWGLAPIGAVLTQPLQASA